MGLNNPQNAASGDAGVDSDATAGQRRRPSRLRATAVGVLLGVLLGVAGMAAALFLTARDPTPLLTEQTLEEAALRWASHGPASYDLDVVIRGRQPGEVHVEVRDGTVTHMTRDGRTPRQRRTWDAWTVPVMFDTLRRELEMADDSTAGFGAPSGSRAVMRAEFDSQFGYPRSFRRRVLGTPLEVEWDVVRFEPNP